MIATLARTRGSIPPPCRCEPVFQTRIQCSRTVSHMLPTCPSLATSVLMLQSCWHPQVISYSGVLQKKCFRPLTLIWKCQCDYQLMHIDQWSVSGKKSFNRIQLLFWSSLLMCVDVVQLCIGDEANVTSSKLIFTDTSCQIPPQLV